MDYLAKIHATTDTRFWVNNPNGCELAAAINAGAFAATTNPAYVAKLLKNDQEYVDSVIDAVNQEGYADDSKGAVMVYRETVKRIIGAFLPVYTKTGGRQGFVTMQDDPRFDEDAGHIIASALAGKKLGPNFMAKIPVIDGGIQAIRECVRYNIPICATEVFGLPQTRAILLAYNQACREFGNTPPMFVTHITGIYDEHLQLLKRLRGIDIDDFVLGQAGLIVARREHAMIAANEFKVTMLGGGARTIDHFTGLVGRDAHVTINWSTAVELNEKEPFDAAGIDAAEDQDVVRELIRKVPEFACVYAEDGMSVEEFARFGPVQHFRNSFLEGWYALLARMAKRRQAKAAAI